jgi:release factor glutamine methyltransferase
MTIAETLKSAAEILRAASVPDNLLDAQTLLAEAIGCDRTYLIVNFNQLLTEDALTRYRELIERRAAGEPLQYITGRQEFFGLEFEVTPDVLIPRPETEIIIEETVRLAHLSEIEKSVIVDVGTGSGCIAITLARELPSSRAAATDVSTAALKVARRNALRHGLIDRIDLVAANLLDAFAEKPFADFIISNPPYVADRELAALQREVRDWEPRIALTDFGDGLSFYRRLLSQSRPRIKPGGYLICEIGYSQSESVIAMIDHTVWHEHRLIDDLQGIPRTLVLKK